MNSEEQKACWDHKYQEGLPSLTEPDPFFIAAYDQFVAPPFPNLVAPHQTPNPALPNQGIPNPAVAIDLAGGLGRHALWLARQGWQVTVVDVSDVAIGKLHQAGLNLNVKLELLVADAADYHFEAARFDLIVLFYHTDRDLFPKIASALNPGGLLLSKLSIRWTSEKYPRVARTDPLLRGELPLLVPELQVLHHEERPVRDRGVVEFVGRKPNDPK